MTIRICKACLKPLVQRHDEKNYAFNERETCGADCAKHFIVSRRNHNWLVEETKPADGSGEGGHVLTPHEELRMTLDRRDAIRRGAVHGECKVLAGRDAGRLIVTGAITHIKAIRHHYWHQDQYA